MSTRQRRSRSWAALTAILSIAACRAPAPKEARPAVLRIGTAFGPLTEPLAARYRQVLSSVDVQSVPAPNSTDVIAAIQKGAADLGVAFTNDTYAGYWAKEEPGLSSQLRGVALLQPLSQYVVVRPGAGIRAVSDLDGRVVAVGPPSSSSSTLGRMLLDAFAVRPSSIKVISTRAAAAAGLEDGSIDAAFLPGFVYPDEVISPIMRKGAYLIPVEGPAVERLRDSNPFVRLTVIPRHVVPGQDRVVPSVGIDMMVVCRRDLDDALVYEVTKELFIAFPSLSGVEATLRFLNFEEAAATPIPLHPGAARYFRERELSR
jgi:uncharacterized protein